MKTKMNIFLAQVTHVWHLKPYGILSFKNEELWSDRHTACRKAAPNGACDLSAGGEAKVATCVLVDG